MDDKEERIDYERWLSEVLDDFRDTANDYRGQLSCDELTSGVIYKWAGDKYTNFYLELAKSNHVLLNEEPESLVRTPLEGIQVNLEHELEQAMLSEWETINENWAEEDADNEVNVVCYYGSPECRGAAWECGTCGESYCDGAHNHSTSLGRNIECVSCEEGRTRTPEDTASMDATVSKGYMQ